MTDFISYLKNTSKRVDEYRSTLPSYPLFPEELEEGTFAYFSRGGKRLRPAIVSLCAGALGGEEKEKAALPIAVGLEFYHNCTLIHDDIIDNDPTRRGKKSVHTLIKDEMLSKTTPEKAAEYGIDGALLCGDALHSIAIDAMTRAIDNGICAKTVLKSISLLEGNYALKLISGETVDTKNGVVYGKNGLLSVSENDVIEMMRGKTGALFAICAISGALIGLNTADETVPEVSALGEFAEKCGIAFQLKDDILGITSTEEELGKPVLNDIREAKLTVLLLKSYANATDEEKAFLLTALGQSEDEDKLFKAKEIIERRGGIEYTTLLAEKYITEAKEKLYTIKKSEYRDLLEEWADFMLIRRK